MLNRRHLRVKVVQALYAYYQSESKDVKPFEKALLQSVDKVNEMYVWMLSLLTEVADYSVRDAEERAKRCSPQCSRHFDLARRLAQEARPRSEEHIGI